MGSFLPLRLRAWSTWASLAVLLLAIWLQFPIESALYDPLRKAAGLRMMIGGEMQLAPFTAMVVYRLVWSLLVVFAVYAALGRPIPSPPLTGPAAGRLALIGLAIGLLVMVATISAIIFTGNATVASSGRSFGSALAYGAGWLASEAVGAAGEELLGRVAILLVAERLVGWRGAMLVSGILFSAGHIGNPGASTVWLARLFLQGVLLSYAVYRTRSLWWSIGYHTGWNWADAPLFGATGSGFPVAGHIFSFAPSGSDLVTGGAVGPEGSLFAFFAVLAALLLLCMTTRDRGIGDRRFGAATRAWRAVEGSGIERSCA